jgi:NDP-sugar pyrophosphorylase family protein
MQAIILAGGKGRRLQPYTLIFPKPLMPIGDYPILEVIIKQLKINDFKEIVMAVGHLKELIQTYFEDGQRWGVKISYSAEEKPLGTAAPLKIIKNLEDNFLVMNGDILSSINYKDFFEYHNKNRCICTIATYKKLVKIDLGVLKINNNQEIFQYSEKPTINFNVSMGVYAFKKEVLKYIPNNEYLDFPDLIKILLKNDKKILSYPFEGRWLDIGRPEDYELASKEFEDFRSEFLKSDLR